MTKPFRSAAAPVRKRLSRHAASINVCDNQIPPVKSEVRFSNDGGAMPMHPVGYLELASWVTASFRSVESATLRTLREVAPPELREIVENVLHERRVVSWAVDDLVGLSSLAECLALVRRCRHC